MIIDFKILKSYIIKKL